MDELRFCVSLTQYLKKKKIRTADFLTEKKAEEQAGAAAMIFPFSFRPCSVDVNVRWNNVIQFGAISSTDIHWEPHVYRDLEGWGGKEALDGKAPLGWTDSICAQAWDRWLHKTPWTEHYMVLHTEEEGAHQVKLQSRRDLRWNLDPSSSILDENIET